MILDELAFVVSSDLVLEHLLALAPIEVVI